MTVWVLTWEIDDYDQYGQYFVGVFLAKPTVEVLAKKDIDLETAEHLIATGGGRRKHERTWYHLREMHVS